MVSFVGEAPAFVEAPQSGEFEIRMPIHDYTVYEYQTSATFEAGRQVAAMATTELGGRWNVVGWNPITETPHNLLGSGIETGVVLSSDEIAEATARDFISAHSELLGADVSDLTLWDIRRGVGKVAVHFNQTYHGLEVWESRVKLLFTDYGRLFAMGSDFHRDIDVNPRPFLSAAQATDIAKNDLPFNISTDRIDGEVELLVLPVPYSADDVGFHLVWRVRVRTEDPLGIWVSHVDAHTGEIVWRYNDIHFLEYYGDATSEVQFGTYCNGVGLEPCRYLRVSVDGLGTVTTDVNGLWNAGEGGTGTRDVSADLYGPYVDLNNQGGAEALFNGTATAGEAFTVAFDDGNAQHDERDVFAAVNDVHDFFEIFDPGYGYSNTRITANVSLNSTCNAYWDGTINFFREGGGCANTGEIQGIVHHEFGHGVQDDLLGTQGSQGLGEGNGDFLANLITQESWGGRGFFLGTCTTGPRNSDNDLRYPEDVVGQEIHYAGQVIAGVHWDLMVLLQNLYGDETGMNLSGSLWHYCRKLYTPTNQPDQVVAIFLADDDDGNLDNGTPHYDLICEAGTNHGFEDYCPEIIAGVVVSHIAPDSRDTNGDQVLTATIVSTESDIDDGLARVTYSVNGGSFVDIPMTNTGGDEFSATITGVEVPAEVDYYVYGEDLLGNSATHPGGAPAELNNFDYANAYDPIELSGDWSVNDEGTDDATTGTWEWGDPEGTTYGSAVVQPEDDHTLAGVNCWVTGLLAGSGAGTYDIDGGSTSLYSPMYNLSGATEARVKYFRYYTNDRGNNPGSDTWTVQVRNDGGAWSNIESNDDNQNMWQNVRYDLSAQYGAGIGNVELKFIAGDTGSNSLVEALVDDVRILANLGAVDVEIDASLPGVPAKLYLADAMPNPFNPRTTNKYGLTDRSSVRLQIFDVSGRLVTSLVNTRQAPGHYAVAWDGTDSSGRAVSSGVYYSRLTTETMQIVRKLSILK